jgi:hypothetical protein
MRERGEKEGTKEMGVGCIYKEAKIEKLWSKERQGDDRGILL